MVGNPAQSRRSREAAAGRAKQMMVLDVADAADVIEDARSYTNFIPIVLAMLCGMRRGR
jgi:hypothetical protein